MQYRKCDVSTGRGKVQYGGSEVVSVIIRKEGGGGDRGKGDGGQNN